VHSNVQQECSVVNAKQYATAPNLLPCSERSY
jgi:hypothetical protein